MFHPHFLSIIFLQEFPMAFRRSLILEALAEKEPSEPEAEPGAEILPQTGVFFLSDYGKRWWPPGDRMVFSNEDITSHHDDPWC